MCWRDDVVTARVCAFCGGKYYGDLGHKNCPAPSKDYKHRIQEQRKNLLICDGCNVNPPFEHRCHQDRAFVRGEPTGKSCQCPDCLEIFPF